MFKLYGIKKCKHDGSENQLLPALESKSLPVFLRSLHFQGCFFQDNAIIKYL